MLRYALMDFRSTSSVSLYVRFSEVFQASSVLFRGAVPLLRNGPRFWKLFPQRSSGILGTAGSLAKLPLNPGQPASALATRGNVAAVLMAANTSGLPCSSALEYSASHLASSPSVGFHTNLLVSV